MKRFTLSGCLKLLLQLSPTPLLYLAITCLSFNSTANEETYDDWTVKELLQYRDELRDRVKENATKIVENDRLISIKKAQMEEEQASGSGSALIPLECANATKPEINQNLQRFSKASSYISGASTIIGPGSEIIHNYVAHYRKKLPVPLSSYGWLLLDKVCNIFFIAHFTFDWLNGDDTYSSYIGNIVPSMMMITIDNAGLVTLFIFHTRLKRLKNPERQPLLESIN
ncbi:hypothetical protein [Endozoicomonas arenosclerae]|uniref:hypothetical protein n=1 Tax=Endozoicomonas arenosclerae TaxID=1633495 RepID=UPI000784BDC6|nr:hypothetical protein [Endozoicomonas arenosclerae]